MSKPYLKLLFTFVIILLSYSMYAQIDSGKVPSKNFLQLNDMCMSLLNRSSWDSAIIYANKLLVQSNEEFGEISDHSGSCLFLIGEIYRTIEKYPEALNYFKQSNDIYSKLDSKLGNQAMYAFVLERLGYVYYKLGANSEAENWYIKTTELNNSINRHADNVETYGLLAMLNLANGEYKTVDSLYMLSKAILDTLPLTGFVYYQQASINANLGIIYNQTGNILKSIQYIKKSIPLEQKARKNDYETGEYVILWLNLAAAYASNGNMDSAWYACKQAEDSLTEFNRSDLTAQIIKEKAYLYQQEKNYKKAIALSKIFLSMTDTLPELKIDNDYDATIVNLGVLYTATNQYASADSLFRKEISKLHDSGLVYSYPVIQAKKGLCINLIKEKKYAEATDSLLALINLDFEAINKNFSSMSEAEKLNYQSEADKVFDLLYISLHNSKSITQNIITNIYKVELERKGFVLRSQLNELNIIRNSKDTSLLNLYSEWLTNNEILAHQYSLPYNQRLFKIDSLEEINNNLEKRVAAKSFLNANTNEHNLPASLKPDSLSANIEFVRYNYKSLSANKDSGFYAAFITTAANSLPHFIELCSEQQLINLMKDKTGKWINENQLTQNIYNKQNKKTAILYHLIWEKINQHLTGIKIINYSTAGLLNNISFPAIYEGDNYLINHYSFNRYFSLQQSFTSATDIKLQKQINIWGDIDYNTADYNNDSSTQNISAHQTTMSSASDDITLGSTVKDMSDQPLQSFNTDEVERVKKLFGNDSVTIYAKENSKATEDNFKQQSSSFSGTLHISTHGFYTPYNESHIKSSSPSSYISGNANPLFRCGLAFAGVNYYWLKGKLNGNHDDGILTGYEISQLDLHNIQLVTLSACETGLGDITNNEGDIGLQRAFKIAGVKTMLVSLWQVPAKQTSQLLTLFYKNWLQGQSLDNALRSAELNMQKQYPPYFWAGFVLIK